MPVITDYIRQALSMANPLSQQRLADMERVQAERARTGTIDPAIAAVLSNPTTTPSVALQYGLLAQQEQGFNQRALVNQVKKSGEQAAAIFEAFGATDIAKSIRKDPVGATQFFTEQGGAIPLLGAIAKSGTSPVAAGDIMRILAPDGILDPSQERNAREVLLAAGTKPSDVDRIIEGHRAGGPMPEFVQSGDQNVAISPYGQRVEEFGGVPLGGPRQAPTTNINVALGDKAGAYLKVQKQFQAETEPYRLAAESALHAVHAIDQAIEDNNWVAAAEAVTRFAKAADPTTGVREGELQKYLGGGSLAQRALNALAQARTGTPTRETMMFLRDAARRMVVNVQPIMEEKRRRYQRILEGSTLDPNVITEETPQFELPPEEPGTTPHSTGGGGRIEQLPDGTTIEWLEE